LSGRGLCDELITRPEESYRLWCVVVCDLETSRIGVPYIYDISNLRVNTVIYVFLLLVYILSMYVYVSSSCQVALSGYPDWGFPCFFLSCKANSKVKPAKKGHGPHSSNIFVLFYILFVLCRSMYCLCVNVNCTTANWW
jgi:hypothetical protein